MNKHTPGPWTLLATVTQQRPNNKTALSIWSDECYEPKEIAKLPTESAHSGVKSIDERLVNGQMMSAAPELLEALEFARDKLIIYEGPDGTKTLRMAIEAIKKARGES